MSLDVCLEEPHFLVHLDIVQLSLELPRRGGSWLPLFAAAAPPPPRAARLPRRLLKRREEESGATAWGAGRHGGRAEDREWAAAAGRLWAPGQHLPGRRRRLAPAACHLTVAIHHHQAIERIAVHGHSSQPGRTGGPPPLPPWPSGSVGLPRVSPRRDQQHRRGAGLALDRSSIKWDSWGEKERQVVRAALHPPKLILQLCTQLAGLFSSCVPAQTCTHPQCANPGDTGQPGHQDLSQEETGFGAVSPLSCLPCPLSRLPVDAATAAVSERTRSQQPFPQQNSRVMVNWCELKAGSFQV